MNVLVRTFVAVYYVFLIFWQSTAHAIGLLRLQVQSFRIVISYALLSRQLQRWPVTVGVVRMAAKDVSMAGLLNASAFIFFTLRWEPGNSINHMTTQLAKVFVVWKEGPGLRKFANAQKSSQTTGVLLTVGRTFEIILLPRVIVLLA